MPRKAVKTEKPALHFQERSLGGARLQNVPEVRAALNPKDFFTEGHEQNSSALHSWVNPQFDTSVAALPPVRRGRRKCLSATSILDSSRSQLSRKTSVCKFPSLTFQTRSRDQSNQPKTQARKKKPPECTVAPDAGNQPRGSCQVKRTVSRAQRSDTPKRQTRPARKRNAERFSDQAASSSRCLDQPETPSVLEKRGIQADGALTPASNEFRPTEAGSVGPPPDVDTPKVIQEGSGGPSPAFLHLLLPQPCNQPLDILVADTPERDYGVKVTWRRRRGLMLLLRERHRLSDSDVLIHSRCRGRVRK